MGMAANAEFYACNACGWRWYVESPKRIYGTIAQPRPVVCPQCSSGEVVAL